MDYRVRVVVPTELNDTARAIARAMDIDRGGYDSFQDRDGALVAEAWASEAYVRMFTYLIAHPTGLYQAVAADYAVRWPDLTPPTQEEVANFCYRASLQADPPLA